MEERKRLLDIRLAIKALGMTASAFATYKLGISYQVFRYRVRKGKLNLEDYWRICQYTGKSFETLWPNPFINKPKPINLTLRPTVPNRLTPAPVERMVPEPKPPAPAPRISEPVVIDVYGGLPPLE